MQRRDRADDGHSCDRKPGDFCDLTAVHTANTLNRLRYLVNWRILRWWRNGMAVDGDRHKFTAAVKRSTATATKTTTSPNHSRGPEQLAVSHRESLVR